MYNVQKDNERSGTSWKQVSTFQQLSEILAFNLTTILHDTTINNMMQKQEPTPSKIQDSFLHTGRQIYISGFRLRDRQLVIGKEKE